MKKQPVVRSGNEREPGAEWDILNFTVDSALLRELGERLVGRPHIALGELIKNAYDADALDVTVTVESDRIVVADNGQGMNLEEFRNFWMRIGSVHKEHQKVSRRLGRPLTGSKGVGRLSVQFLASELRMRSVSDQTPSPELVAEVNWNDAVQAGDLTKAFARYRLQDPVSTFPEGSSHGTILILTGLRHRWTAEEFEDLAREIWQLQPPFRRNPRLSTSEQRDFSVRLQSPDQEAVDSFLRQMAAYLQLWHAKIAGRLTHRPGAPRDHPGFNGAAKVEITVEFSDGKSSAWTLDIEQSLLAELEFEIRIYHLKYRQPLGVRVEDVREYLNRYGGVHVYDSGFHLPYYGPDTDWLGVEQDHAHRLSHSQLLPADLQVTEGLNYLPTNSRIYGVAHVDTSRERTHFEQVRAETAEYLRIQISRDRLVDNAAFRQLRDVVRTAIDYYAMQEARRNARLEEIHRETLPPQDIAQEIVASLDEVRDAISDEKYDELKGGILNLADSLRTGQDYLTRYAGLLGALATAGASALALEHEWARQYTILGDTIRRMETLLDNGQLRNGSRASLADVIAELGDWLDRTSMLRAVFTPLLDETNRTEADRFKALDLVRQVTDQVAVFMRGIEVDAGGLSPDLRLPDGTYVEWSAVFQNLFLNSVNAMLDTNERRLAVRSSPGTNGQTIRIEDTGSGVDLNTAESLFEPFERRTTISPDRRALGLGGTGLGLTIVRMILSRLGCEIHFVIPTLGFATCAEISWRERL